MGLSFCGFIISPHMCHKTDNGKEISHFLKFFIIFFRFLEIFFNFYSFLGKHFSRFGRTALAFFFCFSLDKHPEILYNKGGNSLQRKRIKIHEANKNSHFICYEARRHKTVCRNARRAPDGNTYGHRLGYS